MKNIKNNISLLAALTAISLVTTMPAVAQSRFSSVYVKDGSDQVVRTGSDGCLHTSEWQKGMFDCPPAVVPVVIKFVEK